MVDHEATMISDWLRDFGVVRLADALDDGTVAVQCSDSGAQFYADIAAQTTAAIPARDVDGHQLLPILVEHFVHRIMVVISGDEGRGYCEVDGKPAIRLDWLDEPLIVTTTTMQQWEWMVTLWTDRTLAERFLQVVPAYIRAEAEAAAQRSITAAFEQIVGQL